MTTTTFLAGRVSTAAGERQDHVAQALRGRSARLLAAQQPLWDLLFDRYFRVEVEGWQRLPDAPSLLVGVHSGGALTMDAWTFVRAWHRRFGEDRILHATAHDLLMRTPALGDCFRAVGVIPASRARVSAALGAGRDVAVWPGGEQDAMRAWRRRVESAIQAGMDRLATRRRFPILSDRYLNGEDHRDVRDH